MAPMLACDPSKVERTSTLAQIRNQLTHENVDHRLACLHYDMQDGDCDAKCSRFWRHHPGYQKRAVLALAQKVDSVSADDFLLIIATLFCTDHLLLANKKCERYVEHFKILWSKASLDLKEEMLDAFRVGNPRLACPLGLAGTPIRSPRPGPTTIQSDKTVKTRRDLRRNDTEGMSSDDLLSSPLTRPRSAQARMAFHQEPIAAPASAATARPVPTHNASCHSDDDSDGDTGTPTPSENPIFRFGPITTPTKRHSSTLNAVVANFHLSIRDTDVTKGDKMRQFLNQGCDEKPAPRTIFEALGHSQKGSNIHSVNPDQASRGNGSPQARPGGPAKATGIYNFQARSHETMPAPQRKRPVILYCKGRPVKVKLPPTPSKPIVNIFDNLPSDEKATSPASGPLASDLNSKSLMSKPKTSLPATEPMAHPAPSPKAEPDRPEPRYDLESEHRQAPSSPVPVDMRKPNPFGIYRPETIAQRIHSIISSRLTEERMGVIYVLKAPSFFRNYSETKGTNETWVKIGISRDVKKRINSLKQKCGFTDLEECYVSDKLERMDRLRRIERICHEELNNSRKIIKCEKGLNGGRCGTAHKEWFNVPEEVAIRTVKRWRRFLDFDPYEEDGMLDEFWRRRLAKSYCSFDGEEGLSNYDKTHTRYESWLEGCYFVKRLEEIGGMT